MNCTSLFVFIFLSSFITTLVGTKILIRKIRFLREKRPGQANIFFGQDMAKAGTTYVPTMGGLTITLGFGVSVLLSLKFIDNAYIPALLAGLVTIFLITIVGFIDDVFIVRRIWRIVLPSVAALPLVVVDSGSPTITLFHYTINVGNIYTYLFVPIGVIACANLINISAGFNGLEAGTGAITCGSIFIASIILMNVEPHKYHVTAPVIMIAMLGACLAFLLFNWCPAKIFPGNIGTYVIGASIASAVIIGDMERVGIIALTPQIIEFLLKLRSRLRTGNFGVLINGILTYRNKVSSLTHLFMKYLKVDEKRLVLYLLGIQSVFGLLAIWSVFWYR